VSTDEEDTLDSLNALRCASRALSIATACHRRLNVVPGEILSTPPFFWQSLSRALNIATACHRRLNVVTGESAGESERTDGRGRREQAWLPSWQARAHHLACASEPQSHESASSSLIGEMAPR
jgi:hypothetical protein